MITLDKRVDNIVIIGCGGVTSWLLPPLIKLLSGADHKPNLILVDGDTIETRNLERQWFSEDDIGKNKSLALGEKVAGGELTVAAVQEYFTEGMQLPVDGINLYLCCADNHAARRAVLDTVDRIGGFAIVAGNEYTEAEAYFYEMGFKGTPLDPRQYYPAILTDHTGDPTRPQGCTGLAAVASPQLVLANFSAANHLLWLLYHHFVERPAMSGYNMEFSPVKCWNYGTRFTTTRACDLVVKE